MSNYARPTYTNGYEIRYNRESDQFECCQHGAVLTKKDGKFASYKQIGLAIKFMAASGAQESVPEPKKAWTPPLAAVIAPLEEQLATLPVDAPRFVVVEAGYGTYREQGYAVYDREEQELVSPATYNGHNSVTRSREAAIKESAYRQEHPPVKIAPDMDLFNAAIEADRAYANRFNQPLSEPTPPPARQEVVFVTERKHQVGDILNDQHGRAYRVIKASYWLSDRDVNDLDDQDIFGAQAGWQTEAKLMEEA